MKNKDDLLELATILKFVLIEVIAINRTLELYNLLDKLDELIIKLSK